jgi:hypothetical protein
MPPGLPFVLDHRTLANGLNFTLVTTLGDIDLLGEITGGGFDDMTLGPLKSANVSSSSTNQLTETARAEAMALSSMSVTIRVPHSILLMLA